MKKNLNTAKVRKDIGRKLRKARVEAGYSQQALGAELSLTHGAIGSYERGRLNMTIQLLLVICNILKKPLSYFIVNENDEVLAREDEKRRQADEEMKKRYNLDENLEFSMEMSIRTYLRSKGISNELPDKLEEIMNFIQKQVK